MPNVLVMIPSGEVYDHDCVRWYKYADIQRNINRYYNIGDAFVYDSSLKLLQFDKLGVLEIARPLEQKEIDRYNAEYDFCFLRGSNYVNAAMKWLCALDAITRLKIPVLAFGIGAQAPREGPLVLSEESQAVLRAIAERSVSVGVRGAYTADVLWGIGIKNTRIIGCPTLFRHNDPNLRIDLPALDAVKRVAFTLRREVSSHYAQDIGRYLKVQREAILKLAGRFDLTVMAQGEVEEKKVVQGTPEQREEALVQLTAAKWLQGPDDPLTAIYRERLFYSDVVAQYDAVTRRQDLVLGYRLHGNLIALANRVPSIYFTYDSRTTEFVDTFQIPAFDVFAGGEFDLESYWDQARFERFNRTYYQRYRDMGDFLDENGIAHRMVRPRARVREPAVA